MPASAEQYITIESNHLQELQKSNFGIVPEQPQKKQYIFPEKKSEFSPTDFKKLEKHPLAKSIYNYCMFMASKEGDDFLFNVKIYAKLVKKSEPTVRKAIKILQKLGLCIMISRPGKATLFFISRYKFTADERKKIFFENGEKERYPRWARRPREVSHPQTVDTKGFDSRQYFYTSWGERIHSDLDLQDIEIIAPFPDVKNCRAATYSSNKKNININKQQQHTSNILNANSVPKNHEKVVVVEKCQNIFEEKEKPAPQHSPTPQTTSNQPTYNEKNHEELIISVLNKIAPQHREKIPMQLLIEHESLGADRLADYCIYSISHYKKSLSGFLRMALQGQWDIGNQEHYQPAPKLTVYSENSKRSERPAIKADIEIAWDFTEQELNDVKSALKSRIPRHSYHMWIDNISYRDGKIYCKDDFIRRRINDNYGEMITKIIAEIRSKDTN